MADAEGCSKCGYSFFGLKPIGVAGDTEIFRCPECSHEGPAYARKRSLGRVILLVTWRSGITACSMLLLLVGVLLAITRTITTASLPFRELLANSDLVVYGRGGIGADLDRNRWSEEVAREMFLACGGWGEALRPTTIAVLFGCTVASVFVGWLAAWALHFLRGWIIAAMLIVVVIVAWWFSIILVDARVVSSSTRYFASSQSIVKVGPLIAALTAPACACGLLGGAALRGRLRRSNR